MVSRFAALLALVLATLGLAACGGSDDEAAPPGGPDAVARAASATTKAGTAATRITVEARGFGLPKPLAVTGSGATSLRSPELDLTWNLDPVVQAVAAQAPEAALLGTGLKLRTLVKGSDVRVQLPKIPGLALPGGATWVGVDAKEVVAALGGDARALGSAMQVDPAGQLEALKRAGAVKDVGTATVGEDEVRRYAGSLSPEETLAAVPPADRAKVRKALEQLGGGAGGKAAEIPFEAWVDGDGMIRREQLSVDTPARDGVAAGKVMVRVEYSDFGRKLDLRLPAARDTYDATDTLTSLLKDGAGASVLPAP
jgi:hypothetical protein